ncbi:hypothetical protein [Blautia sp. C3-R-101]|uniref:hypothetical protein n=1 Tax=Blautia sp. C3-R-101 TaxID=2949654 RepID=UPI002030F728|nr:hypothetical protein [Blautia sp. C3-R-101]MCM0703053.1 hypothetical protein [Blautia sp. C3-R-101]DAL60612.1 MAG TPA_asm: hypothetical protein [Caudoviricetes sp.]
MDYMTNANDFTQMQPQARNTQTEMMVSRQAQEVQAAMVIAKKFPRDEVESFNRILRACQRKRLAEGAMYEYPRGGTKVTGPSIRLAEAMAQNWGNIDFGILELEQKNGESQVMAYAWDLETNTRQTKVFSVPHMRGTKRGNVPLTDPRDIYEMVANQGARRLRACILGVIPGDVVDAAVEECQKTLVSGNTEPLIDRVRKGIKLFEDKFSVTKQMIEKYIGCKSEAFSENDMIRLNNIYRSLRDGMAKREDYFEVSLPVDETEVNNPFQDKKQENQEEKTKDKKEDEGAVKDAEQEPDSGQLLLPGTE